MNNVKFTINGKSSGTWGLIFDQDSVLSLMTPVPKKEYISNKSPEEYGRQVITTITAIPKEDEREVRITFAMTASSLSEFFVRYMSLCKEFEKGAMVLTMEIKDGETFLKTTYNLIYKSCNQYREFNGRLAKFILKMSEPNPKNREVVHSQDIIL